MNQTAPIEQICKKVAASLGDETFVRLVLSAPIAAEDGPQKILGRCVVVKGVPHLSLTLRLATRDVTKNLPVTESAAWLRDQLDHSFRSALLCTTRRDWQYISAESGTPRLIGHKASAKQPPSREHDRKREGILGPSAQDWLHGLGVTDDAGKVRASMAGKHRQINRYLEILSHLAKDCGWVEAPISESARHDDAATNGPNRSPALLLADMGCGKGYLTFGAWHMFRRVWQRPVRVIGVEARADLVAATNQLAKQIKADGLEFICGAIESAKLPLWHTLQSVPQRLDALIALHACDTATDDAIRRGIELGARLIVVAPCCHKELRPQLGHPEPFASLLSHGLMEERLAEWVTDGLRALFLAWAGYRTKVFEFVASEHTPKNLMIAAVRHGAPFVDAAARRRIEELKSFFGIQHHSLDSLFQRIAEKRGSPEPSSPRGGL